MMLSTLLFALTVSDFLAPPTDTVQLDVRIEVAGTAPVDWVALNSQGHKVDGGTTPAEFRYNYVDKPVVLCSEDPTRRLEAQLRYRSGRGATITASAKCLEVFRDGDSYGLRGTADPRGQE
jgi:hypothetical protein